MDPVLRLAQDHASAPAFFSAILRVLSRGGALAVHVLGTLEPGGLVCDLERQLARRFRQVRIVPVMTPGEQSRCGAMRDVVLIASAPEC